MSSPVKIYEGNLFDTNCKTLVNTINCVGVMGKGIALEFKKRFPLMFDDYKQKCNRKEIQLGHPYVWKDPYDAFGENPYVLNFPTKGHWQFPSELRQIELGLKFFLENYKEWNLESIAFPPLGCGNGGLDWNVVKPLMLKYLDQVDIPVEIYIYKG